MRRASRSTTVVLASSMSMAVGSPPAIAGGADFDDATGVGVHNAYLDDHYPYWVDALESGAAMVELDVWQGALVGYQYRVGHNPGTENNCAQASSYAELRTAEVNGSIQDCLGNIRLWHEEHPDHAPLLLKLELKDGFAADHGNGPAEFDRLLTDALGDALYTPAQLRGDHGTLDEAVREAGWPGRDALSGKVIVLVERGAFEGDNPLDHYRTDLEYADHLTTVDGNGELGSAAMFPALNNVIAEGDPRTGDRGGERAQWYVAFDGDSRSYAGIDTAFYPDGNYLLVMTDAHQLDPAIDGSAPTVEEAQQRVRDVAGLGGTIASADWTARELASLTAERS